MQTTYDSEVSSLSLLVLSSWFPKSSASSKTIDTAKDTEDHSSFPADLAWVDCTDRVLSCLSMASVGTCMVMNKPNLWTAGAAMLFRLAGIACQKFKVDKVAGDFTGFPTLSQAPSDLAT